MLSLGVWLPILAANPDQTDGGIHLRGSPFGVVGYQKPLAAEEILKEATCVALVRVGWIMDEPTGLGGDYVTFEVIRVLRGASAKIVGRGGHGWRSGLNKGDLLLVSLARDSKAGPFEPHTVIEAFSQYFRSNIDAAVMATIRVDSIEKGAALFKQLQPTAKP